MNILLALISITVALQLPIFMRMWVFSEEKKSNIWLTYVEAWKRLGAVIWEFSFSPFFEPKK